ncbi:DUF4930 family protein [Staphylococcus rostri]|uniref:DUF4930 domain-containing protein n=1 Tax=Staphylococcus rostri TaxID=522262 RepID=A0A2K3YHS9_9STAP|nr:DUF4930 family protein [Staphylococcus rostri]MDO5374582.1 DUF4930 family protein [Staphylococcus rostri]PNZ25141.1 DUF4930 domain-containing protein [Staphylococcus rostri]
MQLIKRIIKVLIVLVLLAILIFISLKFLPGIKDQAWNPLNEQVVVQEVDESGFEVPVEGQSYVLKENNLFRNVPKSQSRHVFDWIDKYEFTQVNELERMAYDDTYLIAEQNTQFILYRFGDDTMRVYTTEHDMQYDLYQLGHQLNLLPADSFQSKDDDIND